MRQPSETVENTPSASADDNRLSHGRTGMNAEFANRAFPEALAISDKDRLLATVEARLAEEVLNLARALTVFGSRTQAIGEELPISSHFGKHITAFLSSLSLQVAYALLKGGNKPLLLDDGAQQLAELGLGLDQFVRELDLDGRRFLAVALLDQKASQVR